MCLELADNSVRYPLGITEDVLVKIREHSVPVDFVILDMGEGSKAASHPWEAFPQDRKGEHRRWQGGDKVRHQWHHKRIQVSSTPRGMQHDQCQICSASPPCHKGEAKERRGAEQEESKKEIEVVASIATK